MRLHRNRDRQHVLSRGGIPIRRQLLIVIPRIFLRRCQDGSRGAAEARRIVKTLAQRAPRLETRGFKLTVQL